MKNIFPLLCSIIFCSCAAQKPVELRFKNASKENFKALDVNIFGKVFHFEDLKSGETTKAIFIDSAYHYHFAKAVTDKDTLSFIPIDWVGEKVVKNGKLLLNLQIDIINGQRVLMYNLNPETSGETAFAIPTATRPTKEHNEALFGGLLELKEGCLKIRDAVLVWPYGFTAVQSGDKIIVKDENGNIVARTGEILKVGGGEIKDINFSQTQGIALNSSTCKGYGWMVGEIVKK